MIQCLKVNGTNCWIYLQSPADTQDGLRRCTVIDPGAKPKTIIDALDKLNAYPSHILLTHGHFDHVAALPDLVARYSKQETSPIIAIHQADAIYLGPDSLEAHRTCWRMAAGDTRYVDTLWRPLPSAAHYLTEGETICGLQVLHVPGHTSGSIAFLDKQNAALFSGDTLFNGCYGRTDLPGGSSAQLAASLARLFTLDSNITVYPGHDTITTIGEERGEI
jgi:glyoxylase-like metal-dependent hydrolase (beta-lactamase superfamily II)